MVPSKTDEVVIHAPADDAPKDSKGQSILKPITRKETKVTNRGIAISVAVVLFLLLAAVGVRMGGLGEGGGAMIAVIVVGVLVTAPLAVGAAYSFARDSELAPFVGEELRNRVLIVSAVMAASWLIYAYVPVYVMGLGSTSEMSFFVAGVMIVVMLGIGTVTAANVLELEMSGGMVVAGTYVVVALVLAMVAGVPLAGKAPARGMERELVVPPTVLLHDSLEAPQWAAQLVQADSIGRSPVAMLEPIL